ncbi:MAG: ice-binding family protein [Nitrospirae bacterium]|nr:ice-binding family protein [Nitrospirota bacterium]
MNNLLKVRTSSLHRRTARLAVIALFAVLLSAAPFHAAFAQTAPALGSAGSFAVLAGTEVTCTDSTIIGNVGVWPGNVITQTNCTINGTVHPGDGVAKQAYIDFLSAYNALSLTQCDSVLLGDLAGQVLAPGVYCVDAASTTTDGTLTLSGPSNGTWLFKIGTGGTGALTGTGFSVVMEGGGTPCNVYWWVAEAATMTDSAFQGTILAGAAITITGGTFNGDALAQAAVTMTDTTATGCEQSSHPVRNRCNQGVGNGPENCDPGNSNQGDPSRSNDELGGTPGDPGRMGGNGM